MPTPVINLPPDPIREALPTRREALAFLIKANVFRLRRWWRDTLRGSRPRGLPRRPLLAEATVLAESRTPLFTATATEEWALQTGKVQNLRVAARALHGRVLAPEGVFSFWANVGRATRGRGFVAGRELREGCIIPSVGGGLCQLSNALYDAALQAGAEIVERHAHSRRMPGSQAEAGRDATVFWNYVDLRFRAPAEMQLAVEVSASELRVRLLGAPGTRVNAAPVTVPIDGTDAPLAESCETCGITECFRNPSAAALPRESGTAWMVDAFQPEHDTWMKGQRAPGDALLLPLDSRRLRLGPYRWTSQGFAAVRQAPWTTLRRSVLSRRLAAQGAARQRALLGFDEAMARALARRLPPLATHLVISQNFLPFLWRDGVLGGRTFDVLMTRLPLRELERVLDRAAAAHPQSRTLADFRAPPEIVEAESAALAAAQQWITPHTAIAALAGPRACLLPWQMPPARTVTRGKDIVFPASTLGRKGAYELRAAAGDFGRRIRLVGPVIEEGDFWREIGTASGGEDWLAGAAVVVLPAWVEHQPRRLLQAVAAGVPVIASEACGLHGVNGVVSVPAGNVDALRTAIAASIG